MERFPVPPPEIRSRVASRDYPEADFLAHGKSLEAGFRTEWKRYGLSPKRILDLGCGCGRIIRYLIAAGDVECHGADIDAVGVEWCKENLPGGQFVVNDRLPPLPYPDSHFDFIYSHSVFTHIDLESQIAWLHEFRRVAVPGGLVRITTMGEGGFKGLSDWVPEKVKAEFDAKGFVFFDNFTDGVLPAWYQSTFHSERFARELFTKHLGEIVETRFGVPTPEWKDPQDTYIIRVSARVGSAVATGSAEELAAASVAPPGRNGDAEHAQPAAAVKTIVGPIADGGPIPFVTSNGIAPPEADLLEVPITSHRGRIGVLIVGLKRILHRLLTPVLLKQVDFNVNVLRWLHGQGHRLSTAADDVAVLKVTTDSFGSAITQLTELTKEMAARDSNRAKELDDIRRQLDDIQRHLSGLTGAGEHRS